MCFFFPNSKRPKTILLKKIQTVSFVLYRHRRETQKLLIPWRTRKFFLEMTMHCFNLSPPNLTSPRLVSLLWWSRFPSLPSPVVHSSRRDSLIVAIVFWLVIDWRRLRISDLNSWNWCTMTFLRVTENCERENKIYTNCSFRVCQK